MNKGTFIDIAAAADFLGPGAIEVSRYQSEITDLVRRRGAFGQRIKQVPATGHPSRFFEQTAINGSAAFVDPRAIAPTAGSPTRAEKVLPLKALVAQINFSLFDVEVTRQQSQFAYLEAKDIADTVDALLRKHDQALWNGADTSFTLPTSLEYYGVLEQISDAGSEVSITNTSASLVDNIKTEVTAMVARTDYEVRPSAIYANPQTLDLIDQEMKSIHNVVLSTRAIEGGVTVKELSTQAGTLPLIPDWTIPVTPAAPNTIHDVVLVTEDLIEYHWLTDANPRVFQLGLPSSLASHTDPVKLFSCAVGASGKKLVPSSVLSRATRVNSSVLSSTFSNGAKCRKRSSKREGWLCEFFLGFHRRAVHSGRRVGLHKGIHRRPARRQSRLLAHACSSGYHEWRL